MGCEGEVRGVRGGEGCECDLRKEKRKKREGNERNGVCVWSVLGVWCVWSVWSVWWVWGVWSERGVCAEGGERCVGGVWSGVCVAGVGPPGRVVRVVCARRVECEASGVRVMEGTRLWRMVTGARTTGG